jgi:hypothetical protein
VMWLQMEFTGTDDAWYILCVICVWYDIDSVLLKQLMIMVRHFDPAATCLCW